MKNKYLKFSKNIANKLYSHVNKKNILFLFFLLSICMSPALAQDFYDGYGDGSDGFKSHSQGKLYMDDIRARVESYNSMTMTCSISSISGTFSSGNDALIIQMVGDSIGRHQRVQITGTGSGTVTISPIDPNNYQFTGTNRVQIIQVNQYTNFYLTGGMVTCHPWDGNTGGVLIMTVQDSLTVDGGFFSVSGLGYYPDSLTWGTPGVGGSGSSSYGLGGNLGNGTQAGTGGGYSACNLDPCLTGSDSANVATSNSGGQGEQCIGCNGTSGTSNSGTLVTYKDPILNRYAIMGNAAGNNGGAGDGGAGSGGGGGGGSSGLGNAGQDGTPGEDGGDGGETGKGARGGGLMYIKAHLYDINVNYKVFQANGGVGESGGKGENGGDGGLGGLGGAGGCSGASAAFAGGTGGGGKPGDGGDGGDGANGGDAGYLWLVSQTSPHGVNGLVHVSVSGGASGDGGPGGYAVGVKCNGTGGFNLAGCGLDIQLCTPPTPSTCSVIDICDCDSAYSRLGRADTGYVNNLRNRYEFTKSGVWVATYSFEDQEFTGYFIQGCDTTKYHCPVYDSTDCDTIFRKLALESTPIGDIDFSTSNAVNYITTSPLLMEIGADVPSKPAYMIYISDLEVFIDSTDPVDPLKCYNGPCKEENYLSDSEKANLEIKQGDPGGPGEPGPSGTISGSDPSANFPTGGNMIGWKRRLSTIDLNQTNLDAHVYPNPAHNNINLVIDASSNGELHFEIYDLNGKLMLKSSYQLKNGSNEIPINISSLNNGMYFIKVYTDELSNAIPFVKE